MHVASTTAPSLPPFTEGCDLKGKTFCALCVESGPIKEKVLWCFLMTLTAISGKDAKNMVADEFTRDCRNFEK